MRTLLAHVAWLAALAATVPAHAAPAAKHEDRPTIGVGASPDRRPADPNAPKLKRMPGSSAVPATAPSPVAKPQPFGMSTPADPAALTADQREKLAAAAFLRTPAPASDVGGKPAEHSTIVPLDPGARRVAIEKAKTLLPPASLDARHRSASSLTGALGVIPRPEWSWQASRTQPADVMTGEPAPNEASDVLTGQPAPPGGTAIAPLPRAIDLPLPRNARITRTPVVVKAPAFKTSLPRDPSLPAPSATKSMPSQKAKQEVPR